MALTLDQDPLKPRPIGSMPAVGGPNMQQFGPGNNLINQQINPVASQKTQQVGGQAQTAFNNAQQYQFKPFQAMTPMNTTGVQGSLGAGNTQMQAQQATGYQAVAPTDQTKTRGFMASAAQNVGPSAGLSGLAGMGGTGSFGYAGDTGQVRGQAVGQLGKVLNTTPDRASLASQAFKLMRDDTNDDYLKELRSANQYNAATGRRGSGLATTALGDVTDRRETALGRRMAELSNQAAGLALDDERSKLSAAQGLSSELAGQDTAGGSLNLGYLNAANNERGAAFGRQRGLESDLFGRNMDLASTENSLARQARGDAVDERGAMIEAEQRGNEVLRSKANANRSYGLDTYGIDSDQYGRARDERNAGLDYDQQQFGNRRSLFNDARGYEGELGDRDFRDRNELRGERGWQYGLDRDALGDRRQQMLDEEMLYGNEFGRGRDLFSLGYGNDPSGAYGDAADRYQGQADRSNASAADLYGEWARGRYGQGGSGTDMVRETGLAQANGYLESRNRPGLYQTPGNDPLAPRGPAPRLRGTGAEWANQELSGLERPGLQTTRSFDPRIRVANPRGF